MEYQEIITKPKSVSKLILNYFVIFLKNLPLLIGVNIITFIAFYYLTKKLSPNETDFFSILNESILFTLIFTLTVSFIFTFFWALVKNLKPNLKNILNLFLDHYSKILIANVILTFAVFAINLTVRYLLLNSENADLFSFIFIEFINISIYFFIIFIIYQLSPYKSRLSNYLNNKIIKYIVTLYTLMLISIFLYGILTRVLIIILEILGELIHYTNFDFIYSINSVLIYYINSIAIFSIIIYIYFTFTAEVKNTFHLDEINQINLNLENDDEDEID